MSPTSPGSRPAGIGEVTSHIASHRICRGSYGPRLVVAVPGVLLRSYGAGVDSRAVPAKPGVDLNDADWSEAQRSLRQRKCPCDHDAVATGDEAVSGSAPSVLGLRRDAIGL